MPNESGFRSIVSYESVPPLDAPDEHYLMCKLTVLVQIDTDLVNTRTTDIGHFDPQRSLKPPSEDN